jgi:hypothetical protein
LKTFRLSN